MTTKKIAVILSGCGYLDGAEIRESVLTLLALESEGVSYCIFAPDQQQHHVVNHVTHLVDTSQDRNILQEAGRIARGQISSLTDLNPTLFDALILPGGFGVAKNLSSFAFDGVKAIVDQQIQAILNAFQQDKKPIGAICIAPVLLALTFGDLHPNITLGVDAQMAQDIEKTGAIHQYCNTNDCVIDTKHLFVTTPAYMNDQASLVDVLQGIEKLVKNVIALMP
ncbi:isoprenoid biosynthesis glyoxalase ElbB [Acinetobacter sp. B5B]|uniref:isoprenoid biosynthesis glyoxalase ElbB n=1 Tax=Acinetobacter baretiae TaxID=2605383 RepID=UPI0018C31C67|nr:isoprenoid biosynthesis glyoxalase ElbB [Acinetobacter baretiae]MBF7681908.1 isoprenoid biosynthesis glyoxalase ElbB [Acinetobacter baretiae]